MVHAALLLLMLEAVTTNLVSTISLKRSTQNLQLSTSWPADYPIFGSLADKPSRAKIEFCPLWSKSGQTRLRFECPLSAKSRLMHCNMIGTKARPPRGGL